MCHVSIKPSNVWPFIAGVFVEGPHTHVAKKDKNQINVKRINK